MKFLTRISRNLSFVSVAVLAVIAPSFSPFVNTINAATQDWAWQVLTDEAFSEANNVITKTVAHEEVGLFFSTNRGIYLLNGDDYVSIAGELFEDPDNTLIGMDFVGIHLWAAISNPDDGDTLWMSSGPNDWVDITDEVGLTEIPDFSYIEFLGQFNGDILLQINTDDSEVQTSTFYVLDSSNPIEVPMVAISDDETFEDEITYPQYMTVKDIEEFDGDLYVAIRNFDNYIDYIYRYNSDQWNLVTEFDAEYEINDLESFNGDLYLQIYEDDESQLRFLDEGMWTSISIDFNSPAEFQAKLDSNDEYLYIGTSRYDGGLARLFSLDTEGNVELEMDYVGVLVEEEWQNNSYITAISVLGENIFVAAGLPEEGPYYASLWYLGVVEDIDPETDSDDDGITDVIENDAPNEGDANNDEILDSEQENVASFINPVTDQYVSLHSSCGEITSVGITEEGDISADSAFSYPIGLLDFTISCSPGSTATVNQYYFGDYDASLYIARKYNSITEEYATLSDAELTNDSFGEEAVLIISYSITDGGELDEDGEENGVIVDPVGPALNAAGVPNTGIGRNHR